MHTYNHTFTIFTMRTICKISIAKDEDSPKISKNKHHGKDIYWIKIYLEIDTNCCDKRCWKLIISIPKQYLYIYIQNKNNQFPSPNILLCHKKRLGSNLISAFDNSPNFYRQQYLQLTITSPNVYAYIKNRKLVQK